jgi:hypothetical protein
VQSFGLKVAQNSGKFTAHGPLSFLNTWQYELGEEILVPRGRQELFESGILHYYQYAQLYNINSKIIARTTTQDRMLKVSSCFWSFGMEHLIHVSIRAQNISWLVSSDSSGPITPPLK